MISFLVVAAIIFAACFRSQRKWMQRDAAAWKQHRAERQAVFEQHRKDIIRAELMQTAESIYVGRWRHE